MDLESIEKLIDDQRYDAAVTALNALETSEVRDAAVHKRIADLAQAAGAGPRVLAELNLAYRDDPDDLNVLRRLAQAHEDCGSSDRAVKAWRALTDRNPEDVEAWDSLASVLRDIGRAEEAREVCDRALRATNDKRFRALGRPPSPQVVAAESEIEVVGDPTLVRFVSLFEGREGVYARQWASEQGAVGYTPIREPFNVKVARNHVQGNHTVGIYPLRLDNTVNFGAIDFDLPKSFVERSSPGRKEWNEALGRMLEYADNIRQAGQDRGLTVYLEDSGWKGLHCWVFAATPLPARVMRKLLDTLVGVTGPTPQGITYEVFPKQNVLPLDKLGNLIKLPMGIHRRTGRRAEWIDEFGVRVDDQQAYLMAVRRLEAEIIYHFLEKNMPTAPLEVIDDSPPFDLAPVSGRAAARTVEYAPQQDLEYMTVMARCVTLRELARKAEAERHLTNDEAMVLMHSLGHLATGPLAVNALLAKCPSSDESLRLKGRLRGNPISCARIRGRIPHITSQVPCNCQFEVAAGLYPNPLLHLGGHEPGDASRLQALRVESMLQDFLRARKSLHEAQRTYDDACEQLARYFDDAGIETLATPYGALQRVGEAEGRKVFRLDV